LPTSAIDLDFKDRQRSAQASGLTWDQADQGAAVQLRWKNIAPSIPACLYRLIRILLRTWAVTGGITIITTVPHHPAIVGWNDSLTFGGAPGPGGYIVQNSWGMAWGGSGQGLFYASYNDAYIEKFGAMAYQSSPMGRFSGIVLQNQVGPNQRAANDLSAMGLSWIGHSHRGSKGGERVDE
jgi:hypothetical protein